MKILKKIAALSLLAFAFAAPRLLADTTTSRFGLTKPSVGSTLWGPKINSNYDLIDNAGGLTLTNTWTNVNTFTAVSSFTAQVQLGTGTFTVPSISNVIGTNTGIFFPTSSSIGFTVSGSSVVSVNSSGITMSNAKITGLAAATAQTDAVRFSQLKVVQWAYATVTTSSSTTSAAYAKTALTVTITPTSASNSIYILASGTLRTASASSSSAHASLLRGNTNLGSGSDNGIGHTQATSLSSVVDMSCTMAYLDSPGTTSATTYTVGIANDDGVTAVHWGVTNRTTIIAVELAP